MSTPSLKVVVAITSPLAFHQLSNQSVLDTCIQAVQEFVDSYGSSAHLAIAGSLHDLQQVADIDCEKILCDPNSVQSFTQAILKATPCELVMVHDSQRALTKRSQFDRTLTALTTQIDAIRPASAFTETLKSITEAHFVKGTIDRSSMMRISTPELIRSSVIDHEGKSSTWFIAIKDDARTETVDSDPESARINSGKEIDLMGLLMDWQGKPSN